MRKFVRTGVVLVMLAAGLFVFGGTAAASDLNETQLVAIKLPPGCRVTTNQLGTPALSCPGYGNPVTLLGGLAQTDQANCLVGVGASMKLNNPNDTTQGFDPQTIVFFGRTTCNRPVPNLNDQTLPNGQQVKFVVGSGFITMTGKTTLYKLLDPVSYLCGTVAAHDPQTFACVGPGNPAVAAGSSYSDTDNWGLSRGEYLRSLNTNNAADTFVIGHSVRLQLPDGWVWFSVPATCTERFSSVTTCYQASAPFQIGPNPGEPQAQP